MKKFILIIVMFMFVFGSHAVQAETSGKNPRNANKVNGYAKVQRGFMKLSKSTSKSIYRHTKKEARKRRRNGTV